MLLRRTLAISFIWLVVTFDGSGTAQEPRTWTDQSGKFSVEAIFVSQDEESVHIRDLDGRTIRVPKSRLSQSDLRHVGALEANQNRRASAPSRNVTTLERALTAKLRGPPVPGQEKETLQDFLERLDVTYFLDERSLSELGLTPLIEVESTVKAGNLSEQLDAVLSAKHLAWYRLRTVLVISSADHASEKAAETLVYPIAYRGGEFQRFAVRLTQIAPSSWQEVGGPGRYFPMNPGIVIRQSATVHRQLADAIRVRPLPHRYEHALDDVVVSLQVSEGGLEELTKQLQSHLNQAVHFLPEAKKAADRARKMTFDLKEVSAADALELVSGTIGCTWLEMPDGLGLASEAEAKQRVETRTIMFPFANPRDPHATIQLVMTVIGPRTWEAEGGSGRMEHKGGRSFAVTQSQPVFRELDKFLSDLKGNQR